MAHRQLSIRENLRNARDGGFAVIARGGAWRARPQRLDRASMRRCHVHAFSGVVITNTKAPMDAAWRFAVAAARVVEPKGRARPCLMAA